MSREFSQNIVSSGKIIDFHTHPYRHRGEFMGMYGEHFYLEPEQMPAPSPPADPAEGWILGLNREEVLELIDYLKAAVKGDD